MLFRLNKTKWWADLQKSGTADLIGYQEAEGGEQRDTLREWCEKHDRGRYHPSMTGCAISWRKSMFAPLGEDERFIIYVHKKHPTMKFMPGMDIVAIGLTHKPTDKRVLAIDIHATSGATKPEDLTPWNNDVDRWKNWALAQYYLDLIEFTARQMSRQKYHIISCRGDYNAELRNTKAWYYPGRLMPALYQADPVPTGIDHLQVTHGSDCKNGKRWSVAANSDHRIHFQTRTIVDRPDYPAV